MQKKLINEVRKSKELQLLETKITKYNHVLEEQIFKKLGQAVGSMFGGGATEKDLVKQVPEMKALEVGLKNVEAKKKALASMKVGSVDALDGGLDQYVTSLVDLYGEFGDYINDKDKQSVLPEIMEKVKATFKDARVFLQQLQSAVSDASSKVSKALKGSELAASTVTVPAPKTGIPAAPGAARPETYQGAARMSRGARGVGGSFGAQGLAETKKAPSLKELFR